eukprot:4252_1
MEQKLISQMYGVNDMNPILDAVLDSIDELMLNIPPNPLFTASSPSATNSLSSPNNSFANSTNDCIKFKPTCNYNFSLKDYVFISKDCTSRLAHYIIKESWGKNYILLYKYLDYIFRCQCFNNEIIEINDTYLIFHTG